MRILITGITGFAGGYLAEALLAQGKADIHGIARQTQWPPALAHLARFVTLHACDLTQADELTRLLKEVNAEQIYHLAGYADVGTSYREPDQAWEGNLAATRGLLAAMAQALPKARMVYVGSGLVYGAPLPGHGPLDEDAVLRPGSPYAASKAAADLACYQVTRSPGLEIVRARPFNHVGPRQSAQFAVANFARQIAAIDLGLQAPTLETGNLKSQRDLSDVRDVVAAYIALMNRGRAGEVYNIGTGVAVAMQDVVSQLCSLSTREIAVTVKESLLRAHDTSVTLANANKLKVETGWQPTYTLRQSLADTLESWRQALSSSAAQSGNAGPGSSLFKGKS